MLAVPQLQIKPLDISIDLFPSLHKRVKPNGAESRSTPSTDTQDSSVRFFALIKNKTYQTTFLPSGAAVCYLELLLAHVLCDDQVLLWQYLCVLHDGLF